VNHPAPKPVEKTSLSFTLLLTNNQRCSKCTDSSIYILLGKENEFIGFFCKQHGEELHKTLDNKFAFELDNKWYKEKEKTNCAHCAKPFTKREASHKYCSVSCREAAWKVRHPEKEKRRKAYKKRDEKPKEICRKCKSVFFVDRYHTTICKRCLVDPTKIDRLLEQYLVTLPLVSKEFMKLHNET
jgi:hypothetical protein